MAINLAEYKNIIFDLGGVLLNIDYNLTTKAFSDMGVENFNELFSKANQTQLFDLYEKGKISSDEFRARVKTYLKNNNSNSDIDNAWNCMLLDFPKERFELLHKVKKSHRTFLLSNTNDIHIKKFSEYLIHNFGMADLTNYFEEIYLSYEVGMRKPDAEIFEMVLSKNKLLPEETLFIDDSPQHIEGAKKIGIHAYWLNLEKETVMDLFI